MFQQWQYDVPDNPRDDIRWIHDIPFSMRKRYVNGFLDDCTFMAFTPLQLVMTWFKNDEVVYDMIQELMIGGADANKLSSRGSNTLHLLVLMIFFCSYETLPQRLEWFLTKGIDPSVPCILRHSDKTFSVQLIIDVLVLLYDGEIDIDVNYHFPETLQKTLHYHRPSDTCLEKIIILLLMYGATYTREKVYEYVKHVTWTSLNSLYPMLWKNYIGFSYKLPPDVRDEKDMLQRIDFLCRTREKLDYEWIVSERKKHMYPQEKNIHYYNEMSEDYGEFLPYEYVVSVDRHGEEFWFHKTMLVYLFQHQVNPLTRTEIDVSLLRKWFVECTTPPLCFHGVTVLRETLRHENFKSLLFGTKTENTVQTHLFFFQHIDSLISFYFPYSNWIKVLNLSPPEIMFIASILIQEYELSYFNTLSDGQETVSTFAKITFHYILENNHLEQLFFGIENCLQDIACFSLIQENCVRVSNENFLESILNIPKIGDILRDRIGFIHLGQFYQIWQRLAVLQEKIL